MSAEYRSFVPTCFDNHITLEDRETWLVAPVSQTRDSEALEQSNFATCLEILGGESETVEVHRFGHWGHGWFELILVDPSRRDEVEAIADRLENYPVLDEEDFSRREWEDWQESWDSWARREYLDGVKNMVGQTAADMLDDAPNEYIDELAHEAGQYANEYYNVDCLVRATNRAMVARVLWKLRRELGRRPRA